jgi:dihydropteroate synthase
MTLTPRPGAPLIMGIVNVTPDSFSDGGAFASTEAAVRHGLSLLDAGADLLDIGGESTRPGAQPVALEEEWRRVGPVLAGLRAHRPQAVLAVDTMKPQLAARAAAAGAAIWNDVLALQAPGAAACAAQHGLGVVLMHMQGEPRTMQQQPQYADAAAEVGAFLAARKAAALAAGVPADRIWLDPGIGFGKTVEHNLALLRAAPQLAEALAAPLCVGVSRKSFIAKLEQAAGRAEPGPQERLGGTLAAGLWVAERAGVVLRVHDVAPAVQAREVWRALRS